MNHLPLEEIERHIEETRHAIAATLRDLEFRLSPKEQARIALRMAKEKTAQSVRGTSRWASANPIPAALAVLGIAGLIYLAVSRSRRASR